MSKTNTGRFFEDFKVGETIVHATPRTLTEGDTALYQALYGSRFAMQSSSAFARRLGLERAPIDDLLVFHIVFGKTVPDVSINAVANLGYAEARFLRPVFPGDSLSATSEVIGLKENSSRKTGVVHVRTSGRNGRGDEVLNYVRWVMVNKRSEGSPAPVPVVPATEADVPAVKLIPPQARFADFDFTMAGAPHRARDYSVGERIDHVEGMTIEEAEHMLATRLYQNTAKVHFDAHSQKASRFGKRLVYGGHIISIARALSFNGLETAVNIVAINAGAHVAPAFAGDTIFAWSEVLEVAKAAGRSDLGFIRLRTVAAKNEPSGAFPYKAADGTYHPAVILDLDYWVAAPA